jgi:hypothetical protein
VITKVENYFVSLCRPGKNLDKKLDKEVVTQIVRFLQERDCPLPHHDEVGSVLVRPEYEALALLYNNLQRQPSMPIPSYAPL